MSPEPRGEIESNQNDKEEGEPEVSVIDSNAEVNADPTGIALSERLESQSVLIPHTA